MMVVLVVEELVVLQMVGVDEKVEQQHLVEEVLRPGKQDVPSFASSGERGGSQAAPRSAFLLAVQGRRV